MLVSDVGPRDAKIMLIGEAPGREEECTGKPFKGSSGDQLKHMLKHSGIDYYKCYVTNVVNVRPPGNRFTHFYQDKNKKIPTPRLEEFWRVLGKKVSALKPNIVIPLGGEALRALTNEKKITDWRGTMMFFDHIKVLPTFHPRFVISQWNKLPIVEMDLAKAAAESLSPVWEEPEVDIIIKPTILQALYWMRDCALPCHHVSFDIETIGRHVRSIAFARDGANCPEAICIPFIKLNQSPLVAVEKGVIKIAPDTPEPTSYWPVEDEIIVLDAISAIFENDNIEKIGQNSISFDAPLLYNEFGLTIANHGFDTMHAWHVLYPEFPKSLNFLCSALTNYQNYWSHKDTSIDESEWFYNGMDAIVTLDVSKKIKKELRDAVS